MNRGVRQAHSDNNLNLALKNLGPRADNFFETGSYLKKSVNSFSTSEHLHLRPSHPYYLQIWFSF